MSKNIATLNDNNQVINIAVCNDDYLLNENEIEYFDNNPAFIGGDYFDGFFYAEQPFPSWTRLEGKWQAPIPMPTDFKFYYWDEDLLNWIKKD